MSEKKTRTAGQKRAAARKRNFATVIYPESAPPEWRETLSDAHIATFISPLHDKDVNPDGTAKKPHYHVLVMYESPQDFDTSVKPLFDKIGGVGRERIQSKRGYARYLCHLDNPEKTQYSPSDVVAMGGANYSSIIHLPTDDIEMLKDVLIFVRVNHVLSFAELLDVAGMVNQDWFNMLATSRSFVVREYIKSLAWEYNSEYRRTTSFTDPKTGEVIDLDEIDEIDTDKIDTDKID